MNLQGKGFPGVTDKSPFQNHLPIKTIIPPSSSVSQENGSKLHLPET